MDRWLYKWCALFECQFCYIIVEENAAAHWRTQDVLSNIGEG